MYHYVQIDENGIPESDSYLSGAVSADNMIPVDDNFSPWGKKYENGEWVEYEPEPDYNLSETDEMALEQAMNVQYLVDLAEINTEEG